MGMSQSMCCNGCGEEFTWDDGGGFTFHLLHCDRCGLPRSVGFDEIKSLQAAYLKGTGGVWSVATAEGDRAVAEDYGGEPIDQDGYHVGIEKVLSTCDCGGSFRFDAPRRCPRCGSQDVASGPGGIIMYD